MHKLLFTIAILLIPFVSTAQVFNQNQLGTSPYGGLLYSTSTSGGAKMFYISTSTLYGLLNITGGGVGTTSPFTAGQLTYVVNGGTLASVATGTLTTNALGLEFDATRGVVGGSAVLSLSSGYTIPLTASTTEWSTAYASTTALTPSYIRGLFSNTATGLTYNSTTGGTSLTAGYVIPLTASTTEWATAYASTTALTPAYIRGLFSGTSPITYNGSTGGFSLGTVPIANGGTGTTTAPSLGQLLMGNAAGGYDLVSTSSLGIAGSSPGGSNTQLQYNNAGAFGGITGATTNGTAVTLTNGLATTAFLPSSNDGATLGNTTNQFSDLYLAGGGDIIFNNGSSTIDSSGNDLFIDATSEIDLFATDGILGNVNEGDSQFEITPTTMLFQSPTVTFSSYLADLFHFNVTGSIDGILDFSGISASDKTFTFPNQTGTVALTSGSASILAEKSFVLGTTTRDTSGSSWISGTSTYTLANYYEAVTLDRFYCKMSSGTGTSTVRFGDGTNWTAPLACSTAGAELSSLSNNTFTSRENVQVQIGSTVGTSSVSGLTVTATFYNTVD